MQSQARRFRAVQPQTVQTTAPRRRTGHPLESLR